MKCVRCDTEMEIGRAIKPVRDDYKCLYIAPPWPESIDAEHLEMIEVWKCPKCGHSETID